MYLCPEASPPMSPQEQRRKAIQAEKPVAISPVFKVISLDNNSFNVSQLEFLQKKFVLIDAIKLWVIG